MQGRSERDRREWNEKIARMKREQKRARRRQQLLLIAGMAIVVILAVLGIESAIKHHSGSDKGSEEVKNVKGITIDISEDQPGTGDPEGIAAYDEATKAAEKKQRVKNTKHYSYSEADNIAYLGSDDMTSVNAILVDVDDGLITGSVDYKARIIPASMTKVLTLLVAVENLDDLSVKVPVSIEATDYSYSKKLSAVGFAVDEEVTLEDLCYGTILCSGADAAAELAIQTAGSMEAFVDMMNAKVEELGLSGTHFTNVSGSYDDDHYSTCYDLAVIMNAAMDDEYCRQVLSAHTYTTSKSEQHPEGITISNWFLRRIEDKDTGGEVIGAKTGYVVQSGNCGVSYYTSDGGKNYICVTANAHSAWRCIYDHVDVYKNHTQ